MSINEVISSFLVGKDTSEIEYLYDGMCLNFILFFNQINLVRRFFHQEVLSMVADARPSIHEVSPRVISLARLT